MAYTPKNLTGSAFKNTRKREGHDDAEYTGSIMVNGQEYYLSIWIAETKKINDQTRKPNKYLSLKLKPKNDKAERAEGERPPPRKPAASIPTSLPPGVTKPAPEPKYGDANVPDADPHF